MIPDKVIEQILDKTDIVEIVSSYLPLKKAGQNFKARCPFHEEKTPSFMISPSKQIYHCFGCGAGGNVISFLMKHEHMDFIEAIKLLADKTGIALPQATSGMREKDSLAEKIYGANNIACNFYRENLAGEQGRDAEQYFKARGIDSDTARRFGLGYAEDSWQGLINYCKQKGVGTDLLEKAGLILQKEGKENWYDRFRNRVIFPIFDWRNRILGFGARSLDNALPKYINSPETYIYRKGQHLYGLNFSKEHIKKQNYVIIVEGYFDLILPFQHDIKNLVATLGTALTVEQIRLIKRFTKNVIMIYDSDKAGESATLRGLDLLLAEDMNVRMAVLPKGNDPDSFVRKEGKPGFTKVLRESKDIFDYKLGILTAKYKKDQPRAKARIVEEMLPTLAKIENAVLKSGYLKKMSEELSIDEESIRIELRKLKPGQSRVTPVSQAAPEKKSTASLAEITILAIVLEDSRCIAKIEKELGFSNISTKHVVDIFQKISELSKEGRKINPSYLISCFENKEIEEIISQAMSFDQDGWEKDKVLEDCCRHIKKNNLISLLGSMQFKIKEAENASDTHRLKRLLSEYNDLIREYGK
ncbi:MAG: DNA primase [Candidatus Omnitrophica bacterium]|nr:DNA primase [Candidatus Omnitrophota bacterium]